MTVNFLPFRDKQETGLLCDKYVFCEKCFNEPGEEIELADEPGQPTV